MSKGVKTLIALLITLVLVSWVFWVLPGIDRKPQPTKQQIFLAGTMAQHDHWVNGKKNPLMYSEAEIDSLALTVRVK